MSRALEVVVVGNGMVGHRLAQEVRRRDPGGVRVRLTIVGDEPTGGYNRVLLPGLIAGSLTEADLAPDEDGNSFAPDEGGKPLAPDEARKAAPGGVRGGTTVTRVDRAERTVTTADGHQLPYDRLVLATGAHANIPPLPGLRRDDGAPARDVSALRTLADARRLRRLAHRARARGAPMAVLGGGILGLEAARALVARGVGVTVVHQATHVMDRQLDAPAGRVLARSLLRTGIAQRLGVAATAWVPEEGLHLADGSVVPAAGLLLSTGARPRTALAQECGLAVGPAGIAVDDALTTSDPDVYALGDCADADPGLVQPGWEQAATLAALLTGDNPQARYVGTPRVTRLKAAGIELACLGDPFAEPHEAAAPVSDEAAPLLPGPAAPQDPRGSAAPGGSSTPGGSATQDGPEAERAPEVLRLEDPSRERYAKLVLHGDRVTGAILLGLPDAAAGLVQLFDRGAPAPSDRLALMLGRALPPEVSGGPESLPDHGLVCRCNGVTKGALRSAWHAGARSPRELADSTRATTGCGSCRPTVEKLAAWLAETDPSQSSPSPSPTPTHPR
ncbi:MULTISPECIES: FAD-dependent oxidoreductase [unclassified Streptomyces]|uniref:FAD-dependent oxidoreductase n=1 Tax=unclassified Streptomyces TaxID=2593676 RepID=UPI002DD896BA|nr:FAD-dependent oxidoreductase [Streptomyces sp. NBC_01795]WSA95264.1 FAD-dependent oxidoreductase [Streptomyces sp. NBC_01795]WSS40826.1 FAD-dependent oxidoreductase [Streptomyces sp. NBC_01187]